MSRNELFSKEISPACKYCKYGFVTRDEKSVLCEKRGVCKPDDNCRRYRYAPLKRVPRRPNALPTFNQSDFEL